MLFLERITVSHQTDGTPMMMTLIKVAFGSIRPTNPVGHSGCGSNGGLTRMAQKTANYLTPERPFSWIDGDSG